MDLRYQARHWYGRVPSKSNPADEASRLEFSSYRNSMRSKPLYQFALESVKSFWQLMEKVEMGRKGSHQKLWEVRTYFGSKDLFVLTCSCPNFLPQLVLQCVCNKCLAMRSEKFVSEMSDVRGPAPFSTIKQRDKKFQTEWFQILSIIVFILFHVCLVSARTHVMRSMITWGCDGTRTYPDYFKTLRWT